MTVLSTPLQALAGFREHPQGSYAASSIDATSFFGKLRNLYWSTVLETQLNQLKEQGSYDAFKLKWHPVYDVRRLYGAKTRTDGIPPSLFWESDVGKWIEAACYYLSSPETAKSAFAAKYRNSIDELVDMIVEAQQPDGYLNIYFTVVDPTGRFKNLRDMHEMYNAGHLLEAALAHHAYTKERRFLDVMIKNIECFARTFGPENNQLHGYPGHPELELAVLRLYSVTKDPKHLEFGQYLLAARGVKREDQDGRSYFPYEARVRQDEGVPHTMDNIDEQSYNQSHLPLHEQNAILGHSVRAFYLTTAAADLGGKFLADATRLWEDAINKKMYVTGGFGSEPRWEGFSESPYFLPSSTAEGGCYAETCASIAAMMTSERLLSHKLNGKVRDILELCLHNAVISGGSLDGKAFSYANKHATCADETAQRAKWFEVCCCPPNLSRTLGMLGGYTWAADVEAQHKVITVAVYLFVSAERVIELPGGAGAVATLRMSTEMPWKGVTTWEATIPDGWSMKLLLPKPEYATNYQLSTSYSEFTPGFVQVDMTGRVSLRFDMAINLLSPHVDTRQDTITIQRGPIIYVAEDVDNKTLEDSYLHFERLGLSESSEFSETVMEIQGIPIVQLASKPGCLFALDTGDSSTLFRPIRRGQPVRTWKKLLDHKLTLVPWFARAHRGGKIHVRVPFLRVGEDKVVE